MTLAISGDWGSGKSTLMELVSTDLRKYGSRPIWFNAWHHQNEDQLLAALLSAIRDRGLPSFASPDGWAFRLRLLWIRSTKHFVLAFIALAAGSGLAGYLIGHDAKEWDVLWAHLSKYLPLWNSIANGQTEKLTSMDVGRIASQLVGGVTALVAFSKAIKAFGTDPAVLLSTAASHFKLKDASTQTSFRAKFAEQFDEVTQALPYPIVIVIDDLDRCRPETVLDVMESVNFLVSSGRCFVLFGMASHRVQAALALTFEKIAKELIELDVQLPADAASEVKERAERERRRAYARDYLEKLINLEISVPSRNDIAPHLLLETAEEEPTRRATALFQKTLKLWPLYLAACAIAFGTMVGSTYDFEDAKPAVVIQPIPSIPIQSSVNAVAGKAKINPSKKTVADKLPKEMVPRYAPVVQLGDDRSISWRYLGTTLAIFLMCVLSFIGYRLRLGLRQVNDSEAFRHALRIWLPVVQQRRNTPRAIKRFGNRIRYMAMLQQGETLDESVLDEFCQRVKNWGFHTSTQPSSVANTTLVPAAPGKAIEEHRLVALGAIHDVYGLGWRTQLEPTGSGELDAAVRRAIAAYQKYPEFTWPPTDDELDVFERSLKGVRLAGDVAILGDKGQSSHRIQPQ